MINIIKLIKGGKMISFFKKTFIFLQTNLLVFVCLFKIKLFLKNDNLKNLLDFVYKEKAIKPGQVRYEITQLCKILEKRKPKIVLEIGTANGGTLFLFSKIASKNKNCLIISIDLPKGMFGGGYSVLRIPLYKSFGKNIKLLRLNSHKKETLKKVKKLLNGKKIDFLFIDGDHTYQGVKKDFEMYGPLVKKDGLIVFHDIVEHPKETGCEVSKFWKEIKNKYKYKEIVEDWNQGWAGIGIIEK